MVSPARRQSDGARDAAGCLDVFRERVVLDVDDGARRWLAEKGYDKDMGARPMARLIQEQIKKPLAEKLLFGELADRGGQVRITAGDDGLVLTVDASEAEATC